MIRKRCAIYTRKSTEEGLEQSFNSLDAQREACSAHITSQRHEGWTELAERYDDGGFSGGSMDRPGLACLLADVRAGRIDVIVVYKVDRMTRALSDFAKMVEIFDAAEVSFVSVTQAFNTTSSMGRLTLNVLLSFAQFEREVTAERIRDKVAASRRKGMWMGGAVPYGYDAVKKELVVNEAEAAAVRTIFAEYLTLGSVRPLRARLADLGIVSKVRTDRFGKVTGGGAFSRGAIYHLLRNPLYVGKVRQGGETFDGLHESIVDTATWSAVQSLLDANGGSPDEAPRSDRSRCLDGVLFDRFGRRMRTTFTVRRKTLGSASVTRRYWYYMTSEAEAVDGERPVARVPAETLEGTIADALAEKLGDRGWLIGNAGSLDPHIVLESAGKLAASLRSSGEGERAKALNLLQRIDLHRDRIEVAVDLGRLISQADQSVTATFELDVSATQNGRSRPIVLAHGDAPRRDPDLIALVADARRWMAEILAGDVTAEEITRRENLRKGTVSRILTLAWLAPDIAQAILDGRQPSSLTSKRLRELRELPVCWVAQRNLLGFA